VRELVRRRVRACRCARRTAPTRALPLVTWALAPGETPALSGPLLTEWVESVGKTAATALDGITDDHDAPDEERIRRIADGTARAAGRLGDEFQVSVADIHTHDGDDWFG
jgi:hypothetical protein